ncbi:MAG: (2Fe-2S)-binding protein [Aliarcobacter sp.]|nr:(2Fe-2S)-binding protein [Aliarcobacter sp.]
MLNFEENYEVCNCKKVTIQDITNAIINQKASTLREIQDLTTAGTECRHCIFPEGDFGKMKKKIYCKDILNEIKKGLENG